MGSGDARDAFGITEEQYVRLADQAGISREEFREQVRLADEIIMETIREEWAMDPRLIGEKQKQAAIEKLDEMMQLVNQPDTDDLRWIRLQLQKLHGELLTILRDSPAK